MRQVKVHQAKSELSRLLAEVERGEEVVIARGDVPVARLTSIKPVPSERRFGACKGLFTVGDEFFQDLPEEEIAAWEGGRI